MYKYTRPRRIDVLLECPSIIPHHSHMIQLFIFYHFVFDISPNYINPTEHDPKCLINPFIWLVPPPPLCFNLFTSWHSSAGSEKNRLVDVWPSAARLCPWNATIYTWLRQTSHDGQGSVQEVREVLTHYGDTFIYTPFLLWWYSKGDWTPSLLIAAVLLMPQINSLLCLHI